jgi:hypothetical protein
MRINAGVSDVPRRFIQPVKMLFMDKLDYFKHWIYYLTWNLSSAPSHRERSGALPYGPNPLSEAHWGAYVPRSDGVTMRVLPMWFKDHK